MVLENREMLFLTFAFLVPGFIGQSVKTYLIPEKERNITVTILGYLTFTGINYAFWIWLLYLILFTPYGANHPRMVALYFFLIIFVSPMILGIIAGVLQTKGALRMLLHRLGLHPTHEFPSSWDWKFSTIHDPEIVHITLDDGAEFRGVFANHSFASFSGDSCDIYLEEIFDYHPDGCWTRDPYSKGLWIPGRVIRHIEFLSLNRKEY